LCRTNSGNRKEGTVVFDLVATHYDVIVNHKPQNIPDELFETGSIQQKTFIDFSQTPRITPARLNYLRSSADQKLFFDKFIDCSNEKVVAVKHHGIKSSSEDATRGTPFNPVG
jgi:hypothetical protein